MSYWTFEGVVLDNHESREHVLAKSHVDKHQIVVLMIEIKTTLMTQQPAYIYLFIHIMFLKYIYIYDSQPTLLRKRCLCQLRWSASKVKKRDNPLVTIALAKSSECRTHRG